MSDAPRILALDLSLVRSGYCVGTGLADLQTGVLDTAGLRGVERLDRIVREVQALARDAALVAIEGYSYASPNQAHQIGELGGAVRLLLHRLQIPVVSVSPATLKRYAVGRGNAKKVDMVVAARERFRLQGTTDDNECDAYLLWCLARHGCGDPLVRVPATNAAALAKVAWPKLEQALCA